MAGWLCQLHFMVIPPNDFGTILDLDLFHVAQAIVFVYVPRVIMLKRSHPDAPYSNTTQSTKGELDKRREI